MLAQLSDIVDHCNYFARNRGESDEARGHPPHHRDHRATRRRNVDFYAGTLGLRMVKKTVNQDAPERLPPLLRRRAGQPRRRHHLLRVSRRPARPRRRRDGPPDRLAGRLGRGARLLGRAARRRRGRDRSARARRLRFADPEGLEHELVVAAGRRPAADRRPSRGSGASSRCRAFHAARAYSADPERSAGAARERSSSSAGRRLGGARRVARRPLDLRRAAGRARDRGRRHRPPHRLGLGDGRAHRLARARDRAAAPGRRR